MNEKDVTGTINLCRLCLEHRIIFSSIFEFNALEMLEKLTSIKIEIYDPHTTAMCSDCWSDLKNAYTTQQRIIQNQKQLEELSEDKSCIKNETVADSVCEASEDNFSVESKVDLSETLISNIKMEVDKSEEHCDSENPNLIAETDYGHIEEDDGNEFEISQMDSSDENTEEITSTAGLQETARSVAQSLLPAKSADLYLKQYNTFIKWCEKHHVRNYTENIFLAFFGEKAKNCKSSSLWSCYSMLRATCLLKHDLDISKYSKLIAFIKKENIGYRPKKSNIFTKEQINTFLCEASDKKYLMWKVCLIFGLAGACSMDELRKMNIDQVQDKGDVLLVTIPDSKTDKQKTFTVAESMSQNFNPVQIYRKYVSLRPGHTPHKSLFIFYRNGVCTIQPVGIHTFGKMPQEIATFLKLPDAKNYTGYAFRRTSAALLAGTGRVVITL